jgi:hypothetical protein
VAQIPKRRWAWITLLLFVVLAGTTPIRAQENPPEPVVKKYSVSGFYPGEPVPQHNIRWFYERISVEVIDQNTMRGRVCLNPDEFIEVNDYFGGATKTQAGYNEGYLTWIHTGDGACDALSALREVAQMYGLTVVFIYGKDEVDKTGDSKLDQHYPVKGVDSRYWSTVWSCPDDDCQGYGAEKDFLFINQTGYPMCLNWRIEGDELKIYAESTGPFPTMDGVRSLKDKDSTQNEEKEEAVDPVEVIAQPTQENIIVDIEPPGLAIEDGDISSFDLTLVLIIPMAIVIFGFIFFLSQKRRPIYSVYWVYEEDYPEEFPPEYTD